MKYLVQIIIILGVLMAGELANKLFHLIIPGNVIGMMLMMALLCFRIVKIEDIEETANLILDHLALFFLPGTVGLMAYAHIIRESGIQILFICIASTIIVMGVTGAVTQFLIRRIEHE
jgi:holin-like protein